MSTKQYKSMKYKNVFNEEEEVYLSVSRYTNNNVLYLGLITKDGEPYADLTVNIDGFAFCECSYVDVNNSKYAEDFINKYKLGTYMGIDGRSGYCKYPLYSFNLEEIGKYCDIEEL